MKQCNDEQRRFLEKLYNIKSPVDRKTQTVMTFVKGQHDLNVTVEQNNGWLSKTKFLFLYQHRMGNNYPALSFSTDVPICSPVSIPIDSLPSSNADISTQLKWLKPAALYQILFKKYELKQLHINANPTIHNILSSFSNQSQSSNSQVIIDVENGIITDPTKMNRLIKNIITIFPEVITFVLYNAENEKFLADFIHSIPYCYKAMNNKLKTCQQLLSFKHAICTIERVYTNYRIKKRLYILLNIIRKHQLMQGFQRIVSANPCTEVVLTKRLNEDIDADNAAGEDIDVHIDDADGVFMITDNAHIDTLSGLPQLTEPLFVSQDFLQVECPYSHSDNLNLLLNDTNLMKTPNTVCELNAPKDTIIKVKPLNKDCVQCYMTIKPLPQLPVIPMMDVMCECVMMCHDYLFNSNFIETTMASDDIQQYTIQCDQENQHYLISPIGDTSNNKSILLRDNIMNVMDSDDVQQDYSYIFPNNSYGELNDTFESSCNFKGPLNAPLSCTIGDSLSESSSANSLVDEEHRLLQTSFFENMWFNIIIETKRNLLQFFFEEYSHYYIFVQHLREMNLL